MIEILKKTEEGLKTIAEFEKDCWINISNPNKEELEKLSQKLNIPLDFLTDPLDIDERARIEVDDNCTLIVLRIPQLDENNIEVPFTTIPLGIILSNDFIITVCCKTANVISGFINGKVRNFFPAKRARFILQISYRTSLQFLSYLKEINKKTNIIEQELHKSMKNEELIKLLNIEKSLVYFITSLRANELMLERLQKGTVLKMHPDDEDLLDDVIIENKQAIEMANIHSNILSGMMDAFASVISNNLTVVMKFLTSVTIILMIPTLIASIYGMNINLPFQRSPHAFFITMSISVALSVTGILIFIRRKWF